MKKLPKSMGACADLLYETREKRLAADKVAATLKAEEERIKQHIIDNLDKRIETGAAGKHHRVQIVPKTKVRVDPEKWDAFFGWVGKNKRWDLLQKRVNDNAVLELLEQKRPPKIPGASKFPVLSISLTKV